MGSNPLYTSLLRSAVLESTDASKAKVRINWFDDHDYFRRDFENSSNIKIDNPGVTQLDNPNNHGKFFYNPETNQFTIRFDETGYRSPGEWTHELFAVYCGQKLLEANPEFQNRLQNEYKKLSGNKKTQDTALETVTRTLKTEIFKDPKCVLGINITDSVSLMRWSDFSNYFSLPLA